ncbi:MAG TPA: methylated-DNA--[protein]-cysteine S-methyltransferase [Solirubrobacteraceae bacterium]|nr:methylated-DNA--[protein]-cysteine S-methyltransferase [Solirubrobacteraceae bacterium]
MNELSEIEAALRASAQAVGGEMALPDLSAVAEQAGLLDVAYATLDSPVGELLVAVTPRGLVRVAYVDMGAGSREEAVLAELAARVSPRVLAAPRRVDAVRRELEEYFAGRRRRFEVPVDWRLARGFGRRVLEATAAVPYGAVSSYAAVAAAAGSPRAVRAAGNALGANPLPIVVPCHRVLRTGGKLGGYTGGIERKQTLLAIERGG